MHTLRADRAGFLRNVCVAMGNRAHLRYEGPLTRALAADPEPLVRAHAAWALGCIARAHSEDVVLTARVGAALAAAAHDGDPLVREEAALAG